MSNVDGTYFAEFVSNLGAWGAGVVTVTDGKIWGGDPGFHYSGTFIVNGGQVSASVEVVQHSEAFPSIFGNQQRFTINLSGVISEHGGLLTGAVSELPNHHISIRMIRAQPMAA